MIEYKVLSRKDLHNEKLVAYFKQLNYLKWLQKDSKWAPELTVIVATSDTDFIGHISLLKQPITLPIANKEVKYNDHSIYELFVQTFQVNELYRKLGIGKKLQELALLETKQQACYQLRSWSSFDKKVNYQVKFKLGFCFAPSYIESNGKKIAGGYFVKRV